MNPDTNPTPPVKLLTEVEIAALYAAGIRTRDVDVGGATDFWPEPRDVQAFVSQLYDDAENARPAHGAGAAERLRAHA